ncbi:MAG: TIGR03067 domain-containing protein [Planctomycetes bacterium]|nr:TIGR03067 domain-containing protein [Planctomycetota bacterium]
MRATLSLGIVGLVSLSVALGGDAKGDLEKLQGKWTADVDGKKAEMKFTKDAFALTMGDGNQDKTFKGTIKIDGSKKPKHMDLTVKEGDKYVDMTAEAIFAVEGDTLRWCANEPGQGNRPTEFPKEQGGKGGPLYLVFKKAK